MIEDLFKPEILLILFVIIFFLFGAQRLPGLGKSLGHGIREFRNGISGLSDASPEELSTDAAKPLAEATSADTDVIDGEAHEVPAEANEGQIKADERQTDAVEGQAQADEGQTEAVEGQAEAHEERAAV